MSSSVEREPDDVFNRDTDPWSVPSNIADHSYTTDMQDQVPIPAEDDYENPMMNRYTVADNQSTGGQGDWISRKSSAEVAYSM
ncbi:uncharacterized protein N7459_005404 [Penicillium hispanicum]|uniref:uncharacterized protein n=1 Tax=Penicillium hispanicum TaxID=1080232 RepID=UPI0025421FDD|nr:uncharacterized protein N7459_005404 [Penicillium hispanicum]KAJ5585604.1 hypothetical protein N7459_005404 [Penicillium hispanicum]